MCVFVSMLSWDRFVPEKTLGTEDKKNVMHKCTCSSKTRSVPIPSTYTQALSVFRCVTGFSERQKTKDTHNLDERDTLLFYVVLFQKMHTQPRAVHIGL